MVFNLIIREAIEKNLPMPSTMEDQKTFSSAMARRKVIGQVDRDSVKRRMCMKLCLFYSTAMERRYRSNDTGNSEGNSKGIGNSEGNSEGIGNSEGNSRLLFQRRDQ
jgi:hypothetical protein